MEAFLLAAGLGTRLRPLTNDRPKALVEIDGRTLLEINIRRLVEAGASHIVVNVHHFADKMKAFLGSRDWGVPISISDESDLLLDTGGGLKHAQDLFSGKEPILIHNVDILSNLPLTEIVNQHEQNGNIATLVTSQRTTSRYLLFSPENELVGWTNKKTGEFLWTNEAQQKYIEHAFSGIAIISPSLLKLLPVPKEPYPIVPQYLKIAQHHPVGCYRHNPEQWLDVGKPETIAIAASFLRNINC